MPELSGFDVLDRLKQSGVALGVVMMAADGDVRTAVNAMKAGAADFLEKPCEHETLFAAVNTRSPGLHREAMPMRQGKRHAGSTN